MLQAIAGTYENAIVQLTEVPTNIRSSKVIVTFLDSIKMISRLNYHQFESRRVRLYLGFIELSIA
jgi:hypothetical protein